MAHGCRLVDHDHHGGRQCATDLHRSTTSIRPTVARRQSWVSDEEVASECARRVEVVGPAPISNPTGAFEQIFGTNQQVPHVGGSDKEAKVEADVSLTPAIAVTDCMSNGEGNLRLLT